MSARVDQVWNEPRALFALIVEDEDPETGDPEELGEIAERLFASAQEARQQNVRLHAEVHNLSGQLDRERRLHHNH